MKLSVIDLGFNSLKLISYNVKQDRLSFTVFDQKSIPAKLGDGLNRTDLLGNESIRKAIDGLKVFREINEFNRVKQCLPVATSAVREAVNKDQFLRQILSETGFKFRVLSGREEALYSCSGAIRALGLSNVLFFDIGGGTLEFVYSRDSKIKKILSLPLGGLRLTQLYSQSNGTFKEKAYSHMKEKVLETLPSRKELGLNDAATLVGVGGSLRGLARWDQEMRNYPINKLHNYSVRLESIEFMAEELSQLSSGEIRDIRVIGRDRAETIVAGALVIGLAMKKLGFQKVTVSTHGLRDGILASFLDDPPAYYKGKMGKTLQKALRPSNGRHLPASVEYFIETLETFDLLETREAKILSYELKWVISETSTFRPEALFYLIMDEEAGLSHREQLIAALSLVKFRKPRSADWLYSKYELLLKPKKSKETIEKLAALSRFLEIVVRTGSKIRLSIADRGSKIMLRIIPGKQQQIPVSLLNAAVAELSNKLDRFVEYSINEVREIANAEKEDISA
ncbi:MAG: hypothetical protein ACREBS_01145 [Nitrososphaerales archaeon]